MNRPTCKTCAYWEKERSLCHRYPPTVNMAIAHDGEMDWANDFSCTTASEWCGEHPEFPAYINAAKALRDGGKDG